MSRGSLSDRSDIAQAARRGDPKNRRTRRPRKSPCGNPHSPPTGLDGSFDRAEGGKGNAALRAKLRWDEVSTDTSGFSSRVRTYKLEVEYSANEVNWFLKDRYSVPAK